MSDVKITSPRGAELFSYLPAYYESSGIMAADMNAKGAELDALLLAMNETLDQFFIQTATWGLDRWENELDITTDLTKPVEQRRAFVESKLRGAGKFSGSMIKNVAEVYYSGKVEVTFQPAEWRFTIKFIDSVGVPPNLDDLKSVIEEIKPAHLAAQYDFRYLLIREIHNVLTINAMEQIILSNFAGGV